MRWQGLVYDEYIDVYLVVQRTWGITDAYAAPVHPLPLLRLFHQRAKSPLSSSSHCGLSSSNRWTTPFFPPHHSHPLTPHRPVISTAVSTAVTYSLSPMLELLSGRCELTRR